MKLKNKKSRNIIGIIQSCLIFALVILVIFMMIQINRLQGTARVINYAGLVRGATQREVKLEITGSQNDELIKYLDDILSGLKYQDGNYDLIKLQDKEYQDKLQVQIDYWNKIKKEIVFFETYPGILKDKTGEKDLGINYKRRWNHVSNGVIYFSDCDYRDCGTWGIDRSDCSSIRGIRSYFG